VGKQRGNGQGEGATPEGPFNNPFAALKAQRDALPQGPIPRAPVPDALEARGPAKAVVRMERKGRGGKEVTVVEQLGLSAEHLERWCKDLKQTLGCGGVVEDDTLVLQGDHRERVKSLLLAKGVRKVAVG